MSLLRRIERAQQIAEGQQAKDLAPVPYEGLRRTGSVGREQQLREVRDALQREVIASSAELFSAEELG